MIIQAAIANPDTAWRQDDPAASEFTGAGVVVVLVAVALWYFFPRSARNFGALWMLVVVCALPAVLLAVVGSALGAEAVFAVAAIAALGGAIWYSKRER